MHVHGPGEMADADFGYVGSGPGKIDLYVGKNRVKSAIPENDAVDRLVDLSQEEGSGSIRKQPDSTSPTLILPSGENSCRSRRCSWTGGLFSHKFWKCKEPMERRRHPSPQKLIRDHFP